MIGLPQYKQEDAITTLRSWDIKHKPDDFDVEMMLAEVYYEDSSRKPTQDSLQRLGMGVKDNPRPIQIALMRRIIDRLATVYDRPATRWLVGGQGKRLSEESKDHKIMLAVQKRARYNLTWRKIDRLLALYRNLVVRVYASDAIGSVRISLFPPHRVMRKYAPHAADLMEEDSTFALQIDSAPGQERWEFWEKVEDGWFVTYRDSGKREMLGSPFEETGGICPYDELPVYQLYDDFSGGAAWLPPRMSRTAWVESLNLEANDLLALVRNEAHTETILRTRNTDNVPTKTGANVLHVMDREDSMEKLSNNPKIDACINVVDQFLMMASLSEDLPTTEFDRSKAIVTGAALRVASQALLARREGRLMLAQDDEVQLWRKVRAVHNLHTQSAQGTELADKWDLGLLGPYDISVDFAPVNIPVDSAELHEGLARSIALGTKSLVDAVQEESNITREEAIKKIERVKVDNEKYTPRLMQDPTSFERGPRMTSQGLEGDLTADNKNSVMKGLAESGLPDEEPADVSEPIEALANEEVSVGGKQLDTAPTIALNGAQVTSMLGIVEAVAQRRLPRSTGIEFLVSAFALDRDRAESIMGDVGVSFFVQQIDSQSVDKLDAEPEQVETEQSA